MIFLYIGLWHILCRVPSIQCITYIKNMINSLMQTFQCKLFNANISFVVHFILPLCNTDVQNVISLQMKHFVPNLCKLFYAYITSSLQYLLLQCNTKIQNTVYNNNANFSMHESWPACSIFYFHLTLQYKVVWKFF